MNTDFIWNRLGYNIKRSLENLNSLEMLPEKIFWEQQRNQRDKILSFHYNNTPWYKHFSGGIKTKGWDSIPIITKSDLQSFSSEFNNKKIYRGQGYYHANTSGSSGDPLLFYKNKECHAMAWAKIRKSYTDLGIIQKDIEARFFGHVKKNIKNSIFEYIKDYVLNRYRFDVFNLTDSNFENYIRIFNRKKIGYVYGYSNIIIEFSKYILQKNLKPLKSNCPTLKLCIVTAEMCYPEDKNIIEKALGVPLYQEYGSSETSIIAIQNKQFIWGCSTDRLWIEIIDDNGRSVKDGKSGRVIITDLFNRAFPFIRYDIGDIAKIQHINKFPFLKLTELCGRKSQMIYLPSGRIAPGLTFYYVLREVLEKSDNIKQFIIIQKTINTFLFKIVSRNQFTEWEKTLIVNETEKYLEPGLNIQFDACNKINQKYSGKIQNFFSEL